MISKELLSDVLGIGELKGLMSFGLSSCENYIILQYEDCDDSINIHELAHKCKEWANSKKYYIKSCTVISSSNSVVRKIYEPNEFEIWFYSDTEPEAIFKACQWILDNKEML